MKEKITAKTQAQKDLVHKSRQDPKITQTSEVVDSKSRRILKEDSPWVSHVSAWLINRGTGSFHSRLSFKGCSTREQP